MKKIAPATPELIAELKAAIKAREGRIIPKMKFLDHADSLEKYQFVNVIASENEYRKYKAWSKKYSEKTGKNIKVRMISDNVCRISRV